MRQLMLLLFLPLMLFCSAFLKDGRKGGTTFCQALKQITAKFDSARPGDLYNKMIAERGSDKMYTSKVALPGFKAQNIMVSSDAIQFWATFDKHYMGDESARKEFEKLADDIAQCLLREKQSMDTEGGISYVFYGASETGTVYLVLKDREISMIIS